MKKPSFLVPILAMINQRPQRERMMIAATSITCVLISGLQVMDMLGKKIKELNHSNSEKTENISQLNAKLNTLKLEYSIDPNSNLKQQQTQLRAALDKSEKELETMMYSLVEPKKMVKVIRDLFINQSSLNLLQLKNLPPELLPIESIFSLVGANELQNQINLDGKKSALYRHALVISFEGDFFNVFNYLKKIEKLTWRFYWKSIDYQVSQHPKAKITLELHTFSREKGVLGV